MDPSLHITNGRAGPDVGPMGFVEHFAISTAEPRLQGKHTCNVGVPFCVEMGKTGSQISRKVVYRQERETQCFIRVIRLYSFFNGTSFFSWLAPANFSVAAVIYF